MRGALPVAARVLRGLAGDRVTLAFVLVTPLLIFFLFGEVLDAVGPPIDATFLPPVLLAVFVFFLTYVLTGIGFLRERQRGTLERILASPASRTGIVLGYVLGFGALAVVQSTVLLGAAVLFLDVGFAHGVPAFYGLEMLSAATALGLGILVSVLARTELQVIQAVPLVLAPQIILGGVFVPVEALAAWLQVPAYAFPLTHILVGMRHLLLDDGSAADLATSFAVLGGYTLLALFGSVVAVRRT